MKKHFLLLTSLCAIAFSVYSQTTTTLILQPGPIDGIDAELFSCVPCGYDVRNFGNKVDLNAIAWTNNGDNSNIRSLIRFDLSSIPANATVNDARLSLYNNPTSTEGGNVSSWIHSNKSKLQRITTSWDEHTVTWNTQPNYTKNHQVYLPASTSAHQDYLGINVTALVQDMVSHPAASFGFRLKLNCEVKFRKLIFASSDHPDPTKRPKLEITYTTPAPRNQQPASVTLSENTNDNIISSLGIFPNPAKNNVNLKFVSEKNEFAQIKIFNLTGKEVYNQTLQIKAGANRLSIDSDLWVKGIYLVTMTASKDIITRKLVVE